MGLMPGFKDIVDNDEKIDQPETRRSMDLSKPVSNPSMSELGEPSENPFSQEKVLIPEVNYCVFFHPRIILNCYSLILQMITNLACVWWCSVKGDNL